MRSDPYLCSDDIEWNEAEGNPLADRNP